MSWAGTMAVVVMLRSSSLLSYSFALRFFPFPSKGEAVVPNADEADVTALLWLDAAVVGAAVLESISAWIRGDLIRVVSMASE